MASAQHEYKIPEEMQPVFLIAGEFIVRCIGLRAFLREFEKYYPRAEASFTRDPDTKIPIPNFLLPKEAMDDLKAFKSTLDSRLAEAGVIMMCGVVERSLSDYCGALKKWKGISRDWKQAEGGNFQRMTTYIMAESGMQFPMKEEHWNDVRSLIRLRNVLAHSLGKPDEEDRKRLERLAQRYLGLRVEIDSVTCSLVLCHEMIDLLQAFIGTLMFLPVWPSLEASNSGWFNEEQAEWLARFWREKH